MTSKSQETPAMEVQDRSSSPLGETEVMPLETEDIEKMRMKALEIQRIRKKEIDLAPVLGEGKDRETELACMVVRLINSLQPAREQLLAQAEIISRISQQLQHLTARSAEERESWEAERESWDRTAEALLTQTAKRGPNIYKEYEDSRQAAAAEADNQLIKHRYVEARNRLTALEAELAHLKPLLLMRPFALTHSNIPLAVTPRTRKKAREGEEEMQGNTEEMLPLDDGPSTPKSFRPKGQYYRRRDELFPVAPQQTHAHVPSSSKKQRSKFVNVSGGVPLPVLADARSEHLLLAARKIGRERASLLSATAYQNFEPKTPSNLKGKEKAEEDYFPLSNPAFSTSSTQRPATPQTPQQSSHVIHSDGTTTPTSSASPNRYPLDSNWGSLAGQYTFPAVPGPIPSGSRPNVAYMSGSQASPVRKGRPPGSGTRNSPSKIPSSANVGPQFINWRADSPSQNTPREYTFKSAKSAAAPASPTPTSKRTSTPRTPLESLYSAARSVLSPITSSESRPPDLQDPSSSGGAPGSPHKNPVRRRARIADDPFVSESDEPLLPRPKRRRTENIVEARDAAQNSRQDLPSSRERTLSALDVLADQAMVFGTGGNSQSGQSMQTRNDHEISLSLDSHNDAPRNLTRQDHGRDRDIENEDVLHLDMIKDSASKTSVLTGVPGSKSSAHIGGSGQKTSMTSSDIDSGTPLLTTDKELSTESSPEKHQNTYASQVSSTDDASLATEPPIHLSEARGKSPTYLPGSDPHHINDSGDDRNETTEQRPLAPVSSGKVSAAEDVRLRWRRKLGM